MNIYRIFPVLWNDGICQKAQTVYGIDRAPSLTTFKTSCSARVKEDPASSWAEPTYQRLLPMPASSTCCYQPPSLNAVTWANLPAWLSYAQSIGYTLQIDFSKLKPYSDIYILGP